jgi:hypothetical protein
MSLDLPSVLPQVDQMGAALAKQAAQAAKAMQAAQHAFGDAAQMDRSELASRLALAGDSWIGACPAGEPIASAIPPPALPSRLHVVGADGSQIYPDRHAAALYYLLNIGSIHITLGSSAPPEVCSQPQLFFEESALYGSSEGLLTPAIINAQRDVAEMAELARLAEACAGEETLALLDNGLLLAIASQARDTERREAERLLQSYFEQLHRLRQCPGLAVAGFIDRPRHADVLALLHLAALPPQRITEASLRDNPFRGLSDAALMAARLAPGQRSARFTQMSPLNRRFHGEGHEMQFFYLNCHTDGPIARVEIPSWVGKDASLLNCVHAGVLDQCRSTQGFPYALIRAHELAVVTHPERQTLEEMLASAMLRHGMQPRRSQKAISKRWTGARRRHRL